MVGMLTRHAGVDGRTIGWRPPDGRTYIYMTVRCISGALTISPSEGLEGPLMSSTTQLQLTTVELHKDPMKLHEVCLVPHLLSTLLWNPA